MKVAVITSGNQNDRKGLFNNVNERIKRLQEIDGVKVEAFILQFSRSKIVAKIKNEKLLDKNEFFVIDGVKYKSFFLKLTFWDSLLITKFKLKAFYQTQKLKELSTLFHGYDIIATHTFESSYIASLVKKKFGTPFVITWHGSDIHTNPFRNRFIWNQTRKLLQSASYNLFVSKNLLLISDEIEINKKKDVLYSGPGECYRKFRKKEIEKLRLEYSVVNKFVIAYVGNLVKIKNPLILPGIFKAINEDFPNVEFWIIGDGVYKEKIKEKLSLLKLNVKFFGNLLPEKMPSIYNCIDVVVLPSLSEGLPRTALEALACGVHVVGSNVGGIPEAIGRENSFDLNHLFVENVKNRIRQILLDEIPPNPLMRAFAWEETLKKEMSVYHQVLSCKL